MIFRPPRAKLDLEVNFFNFIFLYFIHVGFMMPEIIFILNRKRENLKLAKFFFTCYFGVI